MYLKSKIKCIKIQVLWIIYVKCNSYNNQPTENNMAININNLPDLQTVTEGTIFIFSMIGIRTNEIETIKSIDLKYMHNQVIIIEFKRYIDPIKNDVLIAKSDYNIDFRNTDDRILAEATACW